MTLTGRLFQARMWREYAMMHDGPIRLRGKLYTPEWAKQILRVPRDQCLRRARINIYLARRITRQHG